MSPTSAKDSGAPESPTHDPLTEIENSAEVLRRVGASTPRIPTEVVEESQRILAAVAVLRGKGSAGDRIPEKKG